MERCACQGLVVLVSLGNRNGEELNLCLTITAANHHRLWIGNCLTTGTIQLGCVVDDRTISRLVINIGDLVNWFTVVEEPVEDDVTITITKRWRIEVHGKTPIISTDRQCVVR